MKKFAYLFTVGPKIVWSGEDETSLARRMQGEPEDVKAEVQEFVALSKAGYHMELPTGEFIFCTAS